MRTQRHHDLEATPIPLPPAAPWRPRAARIAATVLMACASLGCATSLTISSRDGSSQGEGQVQGLGAVGSGEMIVVIDGTTYEGQCAVVPAGSTGLGLISSSDGSSAVGVGFAMSAKYPGTALLWSEDGHTLRCEFVYSEWSGAGTGACVDGDERMYDLILL